MLPLGHVGGIPVEECLPAVGAASTLWLLARAWLAVRLRRLRRAGTGSDALG